MPVHYVVALGLFNMSSVRAGRVLLTLYALKLGAEPVAIGLLAASFSIIPLLFSWVSGRWSDRFGSRWLLMIGVVGSSSGMLLPYFLPSLSTLFIAGVLSGLSMTFCNVSLQNLVGMLSAPEHRAKNFSNYTLAGSIAAFIGPLIAGFSVDHAGYGYACLIVAAIAIVPVSMLVARGADLPTGSGEAKPAGNLWHALTMPGVWPVLAASSLGQIAGDFFQFYMPVYAHDAGLSASAIGIVLAGYSAATFVARVFLPGLIRRWSEQAVLVYAFLLSALALMLVPFFEHAVPLTLASFFVGLGMGCTAPITMMLMYTRSAEGRSGEAMGLRLTVDNLTRLIGPLLFGMMAGGVGLASVFWLNALMLGSGGLVARWRQRS
jgi:predicted MFS family arabinose efflux permease